MKILRLVQSQNLVAPLFALTLASVILTALVAYRIIAGAQVRHAYLIWNLFLAWLPLVFAVLAVERLNGGTGFQRVRRGTDAPEKAGPTRIVPGPPDRQDACPTTSMLRDRKFMALGLAWLLFFPNAPYIFTDLVHVLSTRRPSFWAELMLILSCALTGFLAGYLSLQVMHSLATQLWGRVTGWLFVMVVSGLSGFGVYLGRFVRLNSWDVLTSPVRLVEGVGAGAWNLATRWHDAKFLILFSLFLLLGYVMLFAISQSARVGASGPVVRGGIGSP